MRIDITGRHMEITPSLREYVERKINKVVKFLPTLRDARVIMYIEKVDHIVEAIISGNGVSFHSIEKANDMYSSVDQLVRKIEKQIVKYKEKHFEHKSIPPGEWKIEE
ncbi:MAG: ribosome-associated translation inhibitor RaiA [Spirochaetota bacterium]|nr:ribosome-associated translation inhibitor RaiA [Spirochaetota bacterium]